MALNALIRPLAPACNPRQGYCRAPGGDPSPGCYHYLMGNKLPTHHAIVTISPQGERDPAVLGNTAGGSFRSAAICLRPTKSYLLFIRFLTVTPHSDFHLVFAAETTPGAVKATDSQAINTD